MGHPRFSNQEISQRGREWYERAIRQQVDIEANRGKALVINIETGNYEMDEDGLTATRRALAKHPGAALYGMRIGYPSYAKIGGRSFIFALRGGCSRGDGGASRRGLGCSGRRRAVRD